jgi:membrane-bound metal-dependent hydrolase YbcI (DUF457 family)
MKPIYHVMISVAAGAVIAYQSKSLYAGAACLVGGVLIDLDHHLDYFISKRKMPTYQELKSFCEEDRSWKPYLIFHSYELFLLLWICLFYFKLGAVWMGLGVGLTLHIICDQLFNPCKPLSYFFLYRLANRFDQSRIFSTKGIVK